MPRKKTTKRRIRRERRRSAASEQEWAGVREAALLERRLCDLRLSIEGSMLGDRMDRLHEELAAKGLRFRPYAWLSDDWYTPVGATGFAIPFYLAHPRLTRLERKMMLEAEGESARECMKILRHETGHAIQNAYRLNRRARWRRMFGNSGQPYPESFQPKPYSKRFVLHFDYWYAQSHPDEDFAETFAVWLTPGSKWRSRYAGWPALKKLEYVDELMKEIGGTPPPVRTRSRQDSLGRLRITLGEHYEQRKRRYGAEHPDFYDRDLRRLFSDSRDGTRGETAAHFLRRMRPRLRRAVSFWTGQYQYTIDQVLREMIRRCTELGLRADRPERELFTEAAILLTVQTMNYLHSGRHRIML